MLPLILKCFILTVYFVLCEPRIQNKNNQIKQNSELKNENSRKKLLRGTDKHARAKESMA